MQPFFTLYAYRDPFSSGKQVHSLIKYTVFPISLSAKKTRTVNTVLVLVRVSRFELEAS